MFRQKIRTLLAILISFSIMLYISKSVFLGNTPRFNPFFNSTPLLTLTPTQPTVIYKAPTPLPTIIPITPKIPTAIPTKIPTKKPSPVPTKPIKSTQGNPNLSGSCPSSSDQSYQTIGIISAPTDRPAEQHADLNLAIRGYKSTTGTYGLVDVGGDTDAHAPQLSTLFQGNPTPQISGLYKVYIWDWSNNSRGPLAPDPEVTLIGLQTSSNQPLVVPQSGYDIGAGYQVMVLYANENSITLKYTREDNIISGYAIHADNVCVDVNLLSLYRSMNSQGRSSLPALRGGQIFGYAHGGEVVIAIRDTGTFMDPRVRKDWWKGY